MSHVYYCAKCRSDLMCAGLSGFGAQCPAHSPGYDSANALCAACAPVDSDRLRAERDDAVARAVAAEEREGLLRGRVAQAEAESREANEAAGRAVRETAAAEAEAKRFRDGAAVLWSGLCTVANTDRHKFGNKSFEEIDEYMRKHAGAALDASGFGEFGPVGKEGVVDAFDDLIFRQAETNAHVEAMERRAHDAEAKLSAAIAKANEVPGLSASLDEALWHAGRYGAALTTIASGAAPDNPNGESGSAWVALYFVLLANEALATGFDPPRFTDLAAEMARQEAAWGEAERAPGFDWASCLGRIHAKAAGGSRAGLVTLAAYALRRAGVAKEGGTAP